MRIIIHSHDQQPVIDLEETEYTREDGSNHYVTNITMLADGYESQVTIRSEEKTAFRRLSREPETKRVGVKTSFG